MRLLESSVTIDEGLGKLEMCKTQESALSVEEGETLVEKEEKELEKIRRQQLVKKSEKIENKKQSTDLGLERQRSGTASEVLPEKQQKLVEMPRSKMC